MVKTKDKVVSFKEEIDWKKYDTALASGEDCEDALKMAWIKSE